MIPIAGVLAVVGWSRNRRYYPAARLQELHGQSVPVLWMHEGTPEKPRAKIPQEKIIGHATVLWDGAKLLYAGRVEDQFEWMVKEAKGVSMGAHYEQDLLFVGKIYLEEISLVKEAGIESTTATRFDEASVMKLESHLKARTARAA